MADHITHQTLSQLKARRASIREQQIAIDAEIKEAEDKLFGVMCSWCKSRTCKNKENCVF